MILKRLLKVKYQENFGVSNNGFKLLRTIFIDISRKQSINRYNWLYLLRVINPNKLMANFLFYKYRFEKTGEKTLFSKADNVDVSSEYLNDKLTELFDGIDGAKARKLNLYCVKADKKGVKSPEMYTNEIKHFAGGVALLEVRNNKFKKVMPRDKNESVDVEHCPLCWAIIDTRPDSMAILVQQKRDVFGNADDVAELIVDCCSRELKISELDWKMVYEKRLCKGSIWDIVKSRTDGGQDRVKCLCVKIDGKRANEENEVDKALQLVLEKLAAPEGELKLMSDDPARKILDETKDDVRNTVDMLIENNYRMRIGFEKSGSVEYGRDTEAVYGIADEYCDEFVNGTALLGGRYNLKDWLDTLMPEDEAHTYIQKLFKIY